MSTTGELTASDDAYEGFIADLAFDADIRLDPNPAKTRDAQPDFLVYGQSPRGRRIEIGAAWKRTSRAGNAYLSLTLNILGRTHRVNALPREGAEALAIRPWADGDAA